MEFEEWLRPEAGDGKISRICRHLIQWYFWNVLGGTTKWCNTGHILNGNCIFEFGQIIGPIMKVKVSGQQLWRN